ncbi:hypothetical protein FDB40_17615 [Clostridium botulinum]|nr:hypothetical protein [Clostridium botulinum]
MTVSLKELYFGCADGDTESNKKDFLDLFYTGNNKYDEIANDPMKFIVYGQKGTGKTIMGRYIEKNYNKNKINCKIFNKDDITLAKLIEKNDGLLSSDEAVPLFKWIIYYKIYQVIENVNLHYKFIFNKDIFKEFKKVRVYKKSIKKLKKIYIERYPKGNYEFLKYDTTSEENLSGEIAADISKINSKVKGEKKSTKNTPYTRKEFYKVLDEIEENIILCLKATSAVIILDDLDELELKLDSNSSSIITLNKLIDALKNINILFNNNQLAPSKCILLIRSDIINTLNKHSTNLNKVILDNTVELYWIDKENNFPERHMLMQMILNKIKRTCSEYSEINDSALYKKVFPEYISKQSALNYMINYSFGRPRDIICYLDIIRRKYPNENYFKATMFKECKQAYSDAFLKELYNEMKIHLPLDTVEDYLSIIRDFGKNTFFASELKKYHKSRRKNYKNISDVNKCLETLYKFGVLGNFKWVNNESVYSWGYRKDGNPNANIEQKFTVHYGLRKILNTN